MFPLNLMYAKYPEVKYKVVHAMWHMICWWQPMHMENKSEIYIEYCQQMAWFWIRHYFWNRFYNFYKEYRQVKPVIKLSHIISKSKTMAGAKYDKLTQIHYHKIMLLCSYLISNSRFSLVATQGCVKIGPPDTSLTWFVRLA